LEVEAVAEAVEEPEVVAAEEELELEPEEEAIEPPEWAVSEAEAVAPPADEVEMGPDWVLLTEDEEAEVRTEEAVGEKAPVDEEPLVDIEPPARPTWVALEEEPEPVSVEEEPEEEPVPVAEEELIEEEIVEPETDQQRLGLARRLWDSGSKEKAQQQYDHLVKSALREQVIMDLEKILEEAPAEEFTLRLLGDAYMRENRLADALDAYRRALANL
jgi:tetratricopeptide (TPR) repeat protein